MKFEIPSGARRILQPLTDAGYEAYLVGGCVRDLLRGVEPHDWDICTSARPGETEAAPPDLVLRLTMLLHDIGKPNCKSTDEKGIDPGPEVGQVLERVLNGEIQNEQDVLLKLIGRTI